MPNGADPTNLPGDDSGGGGMSPEGATPFRPPGGGPILSALAQRQQGPQVSAQGPGDMASSMTLLTNAIGMIEQALAGLDKASPLYGDALKAAQNLSKHLRQHAQSTVGQQRTNLMDLIRQTARSAMLRSVMQQQAAGQQGQQGQQEPGAMTQAPMPSTPFPGA